MDSEVLGDHVYQTFIVQLGLYAITSHSIKGSMGVVSLLIAHT